ncbi:MAG: SLC13 family permease [Magnetospiraceae bacterium]
MLSQFLIGAILIGTLVLFLWGRWRHDIVAMAALLVAVAAQLVPVDQAFIGFGHPAVITVASTLIISRALELSGAVESAATYLAGVSRHQMINMILIIGVGAVLSGFMNNVGALALMMPLALHLFRSPSLVLMPLSFGTILGGMLTEIGTPPNIIIAAYRQEATGAAFSLFDFTPVGAPVALVGVVFLTVIGWRLIPRKLRRRKSPAEMLRDAEYLIEGRVGDDSPAIGKTVRQLERLVDNDALVVGIVRGEHRFLGRLREAAVRAGDVVILRVDVANYQEILTALGLELDGHDKIIPGNLRSEDVALIEVVVMPGARIELRSAEAFRLRSRYGVTMLAVARQGSQIKGRLASENLRAGDLLLVQGEAENLRQTMATLGCVPLAERGIRPFRRRKRALPFAIFFGAIAAVALNLAPVEIAFVAAVALLVITGTITAREIYDSVDWSIIVLLAALIPVGHALETTGATQTLATQLLRMTDVLPVWALLAVFMALVMGLTNLINNAATAVIAAPVAVGLAQAIGVSPDAFLMATAIAASSAFLTPIGHQNNVLVMGPGGYRFGDYWRLGLPLQLLVLVIAVPLILLYWPI